MTGDGDDLERPGPRAVLVALLEVLQAAVAGVRRAGDRSWRSGEVARAWLEHEVAPLVDRLLASGLLSPCPICPDGEEVVPPEDAQVWRRRPLGASFSCGHWIALPCSTLVGRALYDVALSLDSYAPVTGSVDMSALSTESFLVERVVLGGSAERWHVDDVMIGNVSRLRGLGGVPGRLFSPDAPSPFPLDLEFGHCEAAERVTLRVRYVGPDPAGEPISAVVLGRRYVPGDPGALTVRQMADLVHRIYEYGEDPDDPGEGAQE